MRLRWMYSLLCCALLACGLLMGCVRADLRPLAVATLVNHADDLLEDNIRGSQYIMFDARYDGEGILADDRFPDWAREQYEACVYWSDEFHTSNQLGTRTEGRVWGWVLMNRQLDSHILEITYENQETGETRTLLSQWEEPGEEE